MPKNKKEKPTKTPKTKTRLTERQSVRVITHILLMIFASVLMAVSLYTFTYPAKFAPSGVNGIVTMLHEKLNWDAGLMTFLFNLPLLIFAWFKLKKRFVFLTVSCTVLTSALLSVMERVNFYQFENSEERWITVVFSGLLCGLSSGIMLYIGGSAGGVDIIASAVQKRFPHFNAERAISIMGYAVVAVSFFVYDKNVSSILFSVVQIYVAYVAAGVITKNSRNAVEVKIITTHPEEISKEISSVLRHGATISACEGTFTKQQKYLLTSVINLYQVAELTKLVKKFDGTFVYYSEVSGVQGNFRWSRFDAMK